MSWLTFWRFTSLCLLNELTNDCFSFSRTIIFTTRCGEIKQVSSLSSAWRLCLQMANMKPDEWPETACIFIDRYCLFLSPRECGRSLGGSRPPPGLSFISFQHFSSRRRDREMVVLVPILEVSRSIFLWPWAGQRSRLLTR